MKGRHFVDTAKADDKISEATGGDNARLVVFLLLLSMMLIDAAAIAGWWGGHGVTLGREHGIIEDAQLLVMLPAFALFVLGWRYGQDAERTASAALAMLVAAAFVREIDVKTLGGPSWFRWLSHHGLQEILLVAMTLPILWYLAQRREHWLGLLRLLFAPAAIPLFLAGILLMLSVYFDSRIVVGARLRFWEEFIELNGYMFLVISAWNHWVIVFRHLPERRAGT